MHNLRRIFRDNMSRPIIVFTYEDKRGERTAVQGTLDRELVVLLKNRDGELCFHLGFNWFHLYIRVCFLVQFYFVCFLYVRFFLMFFYY